MSLDFSLRCDHCNASHFSRNITHNLGKMAAEAGIYWALWHPDRIGAKTGADVIPVLEQGLKRLEADPAHFEQFNAPNGWGLYKHFVPFVREVLDGCREYPLLTIDADV